MSAPERIPPRSLTPPTRLAPPPSTEASRLLPPAELLALGELTVRGQVREASNAVLYCTVEYDGHSAPCVYKPVAGERPLWDFPDGTLAQREVAAYEISEATGWGLVPPTVLRDGPYGQGMCQLWIEVEVAPDGADGEGSADGDGEGSGEIGERSCSRSSRATNRAPAGRRSATPRWARAVRRCWSTPTTYGCAGWPSSTR